MITKIKTVILIFLPVIISIVLLLCFPKISFFTYLPLITGTMTSVIYFLFFFKEPCQDEADPEDAKET